MIRLLSESINARNIDPMSTLGDGTPRPLSARSIALSTLIGSEPPVLPVAALVALGELFGIAPGTMRTALSRMVAAGELEAEDGRYRLVGRLLRRRAAQEAGRRPPSRAWDGRWHWVIVQGEGRSVARRREFRAVMVDSRFGELRPEVWLRPANLAPPHDAGDDVLVATGHLQAGDPDVLARRLWDLDTWSTTARSLIAELEAAPGRLRAGSDEEIPANFVLSAAVLRHLRRDPLLPPELLPPGWPGAELRAHHEGFDDVFVDRLRRFLRLHRR
jgi:phenylacetic acid degradation operon negative regulatory protein